MKVLVTGAAGFIGSAVAERLASRGDFVIAIDNLNDYYDIRLKEARLGRCGFPLASSFETGNRVKSDKYPSFYFEKIDISDKEAVDALFSREKFDVVANLAAQAGVRHSITDPYSYLKSNFEGFLNILEGCRHFGVKHLVYASSSSVYGINNDTPFSESARTDSPASLYAASKKSNELMAHAYTRLYGFATTGLRYFTVYGPWGRPDMSPMLFADAIMRGKPIKVFNYGDMMRDFTYIDDIVDATEAVICSEPGKNNDEIFYNIYNIGGANSVNLMDFIRELERACGKTTEKTLEPMQPGDVYATEADTAALTEAFGLRPSVGLSEGIDRFVRWFNSDENPLK